MRKSLILSYYLVLSDHVISSDLTQIFLFPLQEFPSREPMEEPWGGVSIPWSKPDNSNNLAFFSAVCFLFAREINKRLDVRIPTFSIKKVL